MEQGYLLLPIVFRHQMSRDFDAAYGAAAEAAAIGERFGDADLFAVAVHVQGLVRINAGRVESSAFRAVRPSASPGLSTTR